MLPIRIRPGGRALAGALAALLALLGASSAGAAELIYAVDNANQLVSFSSATPRSLVCTNVTGLASAGPPTSS